ncbi:MAG: phage holin family protein [Candidatus Blackburnbacteria bacterium]|nr:phage holin family protein [Candidatus Blackburnbacteria bacterium]
MRRFLRSLSIHAIVLWFIAMYVGGVSFGNDLKLLVIAALALTLADGLIRPFINLLLLPLNLVTLGTMRWVSSAITLYIVTLVVPSLKITAFTYPGLSTGLFIIPAITFSVLWAFIVIALLLSFFSSILFWLFR